jgi:Na+/proline symporter
MKLFKIADLSISICLIIGFSVASILNIDILFYGLFITGGWQVISMLVHILNGWFWPRHNLRTAYQWVTLGILSLGTLLTIADYFFIFYYIMTPVAPVLSVIYSLICYDEIRRLRIRPLALYK